jgi:polysaccharide export outer membrane protein
MLKVVLTSCLVSLGLIFAGPAAASDYDFLRPNNKKDPPEKATPAVPVKTSVSSSDGDGQPIKLEGRELEVLKEFMAKNSKTLTSYRLGPFDLLQIEVLHADEFSRDERVNAQGDISLPLIGPVHVAGLTSMEAEDLLEKELEQRFFQNAQVDIFVKEFNSQKVTLFGYVKKPGVYTLKGGTTLVEMLAIGGGFDEMANEKEVAVFRPGKAGDLSAHVFDLSKIASGQIPDPEVFAKDYIVVSKSTGKAFRKGVSETLRNLYFLWPWLVP